MINNKSGELKAQDFLASGEFLRSDKSLSLFPIFGSSRDPFMTALVVADGY